MSRAVLSLGSNLGDRVALLAAAAHALKPYLLAVSPVFQTPPWGPVAQPDYLNAVLIVADAQAEPITWLHRARYCEEQAGRQRDVRWGPRTLDVDVITVDEVTSGDAELTLPHPSAATRAFVLVPWWAADPEATLPGYGSVLSLLQALPETEVAGVRLLAGVDIGP